MSEEKFSDQNKEFLEAMQASEVEPHEFIKQACNMIMNYAHTEHNVELNSTGKVDVIEGSNPAGETFVLRVVKLNSDA